MATSIHPSAFVSKEAVLGDGVEVGPQCTVMGKVVIGAGSRLITGVYLNGPAEIGENCTFYPGVSIGFPGQDLKFKPGMVTAGVKLGKNGMYREAVTIHAATNDHTPTTVGDDAFFMVGVHAAHDVKVGNGVTIVNNSALGGFAEIHDRVMLGGGALVHQFGRVGRMAFVSGATICTCDIPPYCVAYQRNRLIGLNLVGLRRAGIPRNQITLLREAYRKTFRAGVQKGEMVEILRSMGEACPPALDMAKFIEEAKRPIAKHHASEIAKESSEFDGAA
jgi:UDP-N-acetylglucosamine acyltransferase